MYSISYFSQIFILGPTVIQARFYIDVSRYNICTVILIILTSTYPFFTIMFIMLFRLCTIFVILQCTFIEKCENKLKLKLKYFSKDYALHNYDRRVVHPKQLV